MKFRAQRYPGGLAVTLQSAGRSWPGRLANVSVSGARIDEVSGPRLDEAVTLVAGGERVAALVRRVGPGRVGLRFEPPISTVRLARLKGTPRTVAGRHLRPGNRFQEL